MDNVFITQYFDWHRAGNRKLQWVNWLLCKCGFKSRVVPPQATGEQTSIEQRINLYHLANFVLFNGVPGEFVEVGSHTGSTAALLQTVLRLHRPMRDLHVYDAFLDATQNQLLENFLALALRPPVIHAGQCQETLPSQLPEQIAFAHLDVGWKQGFEQHRDTMLACLESIYPRLSAGAICVVADYSESDVYTRQKFSVPAIVASSDCWSHYPSAKVACDAFFADKPETMALLYGGPYSHGYFRKGCDAAHATKGHNHE